MREIYLVTRPERAWHWIHAAGIVLLALSGLNIHFAREFNVFGTLPTAITVHNAVGFLVSFDYVLWALYMVGTGRIRFYAPNREDLLQGVVRQARFYLSGIFRGAPHPFEVSAARKFNPLQKWTYVGVMMVLLPLQIVTGLWLYYTIRDWQLARLASLTVLGVTHTVLGILLTAFLIAHVYLATTGETVWADLKMMLTGYTTPHVAPRPEDRGTEP